jgi:hypothetical protein
MNLSASGNNTHFRWQQPNLSGPVLKGAADATRDRKSEGNPETRQIDRPGTGTGPIHKPPRGAKVNTVKDENGPAAMMVLTS